MEREKTSFVFVPTANNLEAIYREEIIKAEAENAMDADAEMARQFPYSEMAKFGWVPETKEVKEIVVNLRKYFEVVELSLHWK